MVIIIEKSKTKYCAVTFKFFMTDRFDKFIY